MAVETSSHEALFVEHLPIVDRAVASFGGRYGLSADEVADLASTIKLRIVEEGYAVFAKFRGESSLSTYLTVVVTMMAREHMVQQRGRWRPSAEARRRGPVAVRLETLVHQKGHSLPEAAAILRSRTETTLSDRELGDLLRLLPRRAPLRPVQVSEIAIDGATAVDAADADVTAQERQSLRQDMERVLAESVEALPLEDRLLLKLRFWEQASVADAARILGVEQRPLYRRLEKLLGELRTRLAAAGVSADEVRELTGEPT